MSRPRTRVIPVLLLDGGQLWKTTRFADPVYVGDPINTTRIFNDKEVDELVLLDVGATRDRRPPDLELLAALAEECFMPLCYGGGVRGTDDVAALLAIGMEKVSLGAVAVDDEGVVAEAASLFGRQSVVVSVDVRPGSAGRHTVFVDNGRRDTGRDVLTHARRVVELGAGELLLTAIDREGTGAGYDRDLVRTVCAAVDVPVVAHGGAAGLADLAHAREDGASAAAAGSQFVFHGPWRAVLVTYPERAELPALVAAESREAGRG